MSNDRPTQSLNRIASELGEWVLGNVAEVDADPPGEAARVQDDGAREHLTFGARAYRKHRHR